MAYTVLFTRACHDAEFSRASMSSKTGSTMDSLPAPFGGT
jgi:hypothetical protein